MNTYKDILIGADIELFVRDEQTQEFVSAEPYIPGTKDKPFCFDKSSKYFAVSLDNVLAEFCIPPAKSKDEFYKSICRSVEYINQIIPKGMCTVATPSVVFDPKYLQTENAKLFGCEEDYNAYTGAANTKPCAADACLRSAGGHLHFGFANAPLYNKNFYIADDVHTQLIKSADLHIGVPSVIMEPDNIRKQLYGKAGAFRPKPYGVEYRTVSNFYLASKQLTDWVYEAAQDAVGFLNAGKVITDDLADFIQNTINSSNKAQALELINFFKLKVA